MENSNIKLHICSELIALEQRQREERERMLDEWKNKQNYVNAQFALFQESLSVNEDNSREIHNETDTRC